MTTKCFHHTGEQFSAELILIANDTTSESHASLLLTTGRRVYWNLGSPPHLISQAETDMDAFMTDVKELLRQQFPRVMETSEQAENIELHVL